MFIQIYNLYKYIYINILCVNDVSITNAKNTFANLKHIMILILTI